MFGQFREQGSGRACHARMLRCRAGTCNAMNRPPKIARAMDGPRDGRAHWAAKFKGRLAVTPEAILAHAPRVLTPGQREAYFSSGFVAAPDLIPGEWLRRLADLSAEFLEASKALSASNEAYDLGPLHRADRPHVRRLRALVDRHPDFWRFASESVLADIAADLVGPDVKFHSSKLNYKWPGAGEIVD